MKKFLNILKQASLSEKDLEQIQKIGTFCNIKTNKTLLNYGEYCMAIYFIIKGGFAMQILTDEGHDRTINFLLDSAFHLPIR